MGRYVRNFKALTIEEAIYKMTGKIAATFHLSDRGVIREGNWADFVIFDPETIIDNGTFDEPCQFPEGILRVLINEVLILDNGKRGEQLSGQVLWWLSHIVNGMIE